MRKRDAEMLGLGAALNYSPPARMEATYDTMMREVARWTYDKPHAGTEERVHYAFALLCAEIDRMKSILESLCPTRDIMD